MRKKPLRFLLPLALVALIAVTALTGCDGDTANTGRSAPSGEATDVGQGQTVFRFEVVDGDGEATAFNVHTDERIVGDALLAVKLIEGTVGQYGLYVEKVNGITADFETDMSYWAFYVDGEYAMAGVDATDIEPNRTYSFVYTKE